MPLLGNAHEFNDTTVGVIPAKTGIQDSWMLDFSQASCPHYERVGSRYTIFNFPLIPTELQKNRSTRPPGIALPEKPEGLSPAA